jgi:hypothetical protein
VLVEFYDDISPSSKSFAPEYAAASAKLSQMRVPVVIARVSCDVLTPEGPRICDKYNVTSTPALIWFAKGVPKAINLTGIDLSSSFVVSLVVEKSGFSPPATSPPTPDPCESRRIGGSCISIPAAAFYAILAVAVVHVLQVFAWVVLSRQRALFSFLRFSVLLFVPLLGIVVWLPLCRQKSEESRDKKATLLVDVEAGHVIRQ